MRANRRGGSPRAGTGRGRNQSAIPPAKSIRYGRALRSVGGVDALQITPVHYVFQPGGDGTYAYYKDIGDAVGLPIVIYNVVPWNTVAPETLLRLSEIPQVIAVKQSGGDIHKLAEFVATE